MQDTLSISILNSMEEPFNQLSANCYLWKLSQYEYLDTKIGIAWQFVVMYI